MLSYQLEDGNWISKCSGNCKKEFDFATRLNPRVGLDKQGLFEPYVFVDQQWVDSQYLAPDGHYFLRWKKERTEWQKFIKGLARRQSDYAARWCADAVCCCGGGVAAYCCVGSTNPDNAESSGNGAICDGIEAIFDVLMYLYQCLSCIPCGCNDCIECGDSVCTECTDCSACSNCCDSCGTCCSDCGGDCCSSVCNGCGGCGGCNCKAC